MIFKMIKVWGVGLYGLDEASLVLRDWSCSAKVPKCLPKGELQPRKCTGVLRGRVQRYGINIKGKLQKSIVVTAARPGRA